MNYEFYNRKSFIQTNNELKKETNVNNYIDGDKKRVNVNQKLDELSINSGISFSGNVIRQNIVNSSSSSISTLGNVSETSVYDTTKSKNEEEKKNSNNNEMDKRINNGLNMGKKIASNMNNRFNRNI